MGADGIWNPADYITNRYEIDNPYYEGKSLFGNIARKNFNKIPQDAMDYIRGEVQKRIDSGYMLNKWFLRMLENQVKANWPNDIPSNWDISSAISTDKGMAKHINKQNNLTPGGTKRVGNTQEQVAEANPGDTVLAGGKSVKLSQKDIDKAQQNTGISEENAEIIGDASDAFRRRHLAEKVSPHDPNSYANKQEALEQEALDAKNDRESTTTASKPTEREQALRENAQSALDEKNAQREQDWQDIQSKNQEQNTAAEQTAKVQNTGVQQSLQNKSIQDANNEKMKALYGNNAAQQDSSDIYSQTVSDIAGDDNAMSVEGNEETDERLIPVEQYMPKNANGSVNFNGFKAKMTKGGQVGYNTRLLKQQIANRDKYEKGSVEWTANNDKAKETLKTLENYCEPWE